jgi:hypothetical protein
MLKIMYNRSYKENQMKQNTIMHNSGILAFVLCILMCISTSSWAANYYVDSIAGSDTNSGTQSAPWKTIAKVNAATLNAGDKVMFMSGRTWREQLTMKYSGVAGSPITFGAYGSGEKPIISGGSYITGGWTQYSGTTYRISISLWVDRSGHARVFTGSTQLTQSSSATLSANQYYFQYSTAPGTSGALTSGTLYVNIGKAPGATDIEATVRKKAIDCNKSYITFDGLHLTKAAYALGQNAAQSDGVIIRNCIFDFCTMGIYCGASTTSNARGWLVENCSFLNNGQNTVFDQSVYTKFCSGWTIQKNVFKNAGVGAYAIDVNGSSNNIIRYNYSEGNGGGFMEFYEDTAGGSKNNQVYYNISVNDRGFIYSGGGPDHTGNVVYNNVIYNSNYGLSIESGNLSAFKNNIIWSTKSNAKYISVAAGASITSSSNNIIGPFGSGAVISYQGSTYSSLAAFKGAFSSLEVNSTSTNPLFVNAGTDFHLTGSSPARYAGVKLSLTSDFQGTALTSGNNPDVGAYQYGGTKLNPPSNLRIQ